MLLAHLADLHLGYRAYHRLGPGGGTVLLHDADRTSAPGSWTRTLAAAEELLSEWAGSSLDVGPLGACRREKNA